MDKKPLYREFDLSELKEVFEEHKPKLQAFEWVDKEKTRVRMVDYDNSGKLSGFIVMTSEAFDEAMKRAVHKRNSLYPT